MSILKINSTKFNNNFVTSVLKNIVEKQWQTDLCITVKKTTLICL